MCLPSHDRKPFVSTFTGTRVSAATLAKFAPLCASAGYVRDDSDPRWFHSAWFSILFGECVVKISTPDDRDSWGCFSEEQIVAFLVHGDLPQN